MAVTGSGLFAGTFKDVLTNTQALDLSAEDMKCALFTNTITPDFDATAANARYGAGVFASGQSSGTGYTAGGATLTTTTIASASGVITFDAADVSWATSTIAAARCALIYADALTSPQADPAVALINFGADYATTVGTLTIQWSASGIFTWDLVP